MGTESETEATRELLDRLVWEPTTFRYLGFDIYRLEIDLTEGNIRRAIQTCRCDVNFWEKKNCRFRRWARLLWLKWSLPRFLYLFVTLQVRVKRATFQELDTPLVELIWGSVRRRLSLQKLKLPITRGDVAATDFKLYYLASQLQWLTRRVDNAINYENRAAVRMSEISQLAKILFGLVDS